MTLRTLALCLVLTLLISPESVADEVVLKNGRSIRGTVLRQNDREVVLRLEGGQKLKLPRAMIKSIKTTKSGGDDKTDTTKTPQAVRLRWAMKPGQTVKFRALFVMESKPSKTPRTSLGLEEHTNDYTLKCEAARVDDLTLDLRIERTQKRKVDKAGKETKLDSKATDPAEQPKDMSMVGKSIRFQLSRRGEVQKLLTIGGVPLASLEPHKQRLLEKAIGTYLLRFNLLGLVGVFPKAAARPQRDRWKDSVVISDTPLGDLEVRVTNTLERAGGGEALVRQTGSMAVRGMQKRRLITSRVRGRVRFSTRDGCMLEVKQTSTGQFRYGEGTSTVDVDLILTCRVSRR